MMSMKARLVMMLLATLVLTTLPLPTFLSVIRPAWVLLFVLYVQCYLPIYFRVTSIFILGLCLDVMCSTVMGEHAFALVLTVWLASSKVRRFGFFSTIQQMSVIVLYGLFYQGIIFLLDSFQGNISSLLQVMGVALTSMLCWPWLGMLTNGITRSHYDRYSH